MQSFKNVLLNIKEGLKNSWSKTLFSFSGLAEKTYQCLEKSKSIISAHNPERQLKLGYSIASINGKIIKSIENTAIGDNMNLRVADGSIVSQIKNINKSY